MTERIGLASRISTVHTLAGCGALGYNDGRNAVAQFAYPSGIATDKHGNVYVADTYNHRIRIITPDGYVSLFAGSSNGFADGQDTSARFSFPSGLVIDDDGNMFVADRGNHRIRKITPNGYVSTFAGTVKGYSDGKGPDACFCSPIGITIDAFSDIYVADYGNHRIRKITPGAYVTTFAGSNKGYADGKGDEAMFTSPFGVTADLQGNIFIADLGNHRIRKVCPGRMVTTYGGGNQGYANGQSAKAMFAHPYAVAVDNSGNVYISDWGNNNIRKISPGGVVSTIAGASDGYGFVNGEAHYAKFNVPTGVAINHNNTTLYVADRNNHVIRKIELEL